MPSLFDRTQAASDEVDELIRLVALTTNESCDRHEEEEDGETPTGEEPVKKLWLAIKKMGQERVFLREKLKVLWNEISSLMSAIANGEVSRARAVGNQRRACLAFKQAAEDLITKNITSAPDDANTEAEDERILQHNQSEAHALRVGLLRRGVYFGRGPIMPLAAFDTDKLSNMGFSVECLARYAIINNQRVLGISLDFIRERTLNQIDDPETNKLAARIRRAKDFKSMDKVTQDVFESNFASFLESFHAHEPGLQVVGIPSHWAGARWYWMMPQGELRGLRSAGIGGAAFRLARWAFAFKSEVNPKSSQPLIHHP